MAASGCFLSGSHVCVRSALLPTTSSPTGSRLPHLATSGELWSGGAWSHTQRARTRHGWDLLGTGTLALGSQGWGWGAVSWAPFPSWPGAGGSKAHLERQARRPGSCSPHCCRPCTRTSCCVPRSQWPAGSGRSPCGRAFGSGPQGSGRPGPALRSYHIWEEQNVAQSFRVPSPCPRPCAWVRKATRARLPVRVTPALHPCHIGLGVP